MVEALGKSMAQAWSYFYVLKGIHEGAKASPSVTARFPWLMDQIWRAMLDAFFAKVGTLIDSTSSTYSLPNLITLVRRYGDAELKALIPEAEACLSEKAGPLAKIKNWRHSKVAHQSARGDPDSFKDWKILPPCTLLSAVFGLLHCPPLFPTYTRYLNMTPLLQLTDLSLAFGPHVLLDHVNLTVHRGQRIGILGRNGAGKSTLLKLLDGQNAPDSGELWLRPGITVSYLHQDLPGADDKSVYDVVASGLARLGELLRQFHHLSAEAHDDAGLKRLARVQEQIEAQDGWAFQQKIDAVMASLNLPVDTPMKALSGGWRRRVAIARLLVSEPDVVLLDEPTNHLDIPTIQWLEKQLENFSGALLVITHDRAFLQRIATSIIEIDRGNLRCWDGDYQGFLKFQAQQLAAEERANELFDKKLAQEEVWIRQGIKARRTRNEGRVRDLKKMREERAQRRERQANANFAIESGGLSGKIVVDAENLTKTYNGQTLVKNFSTKILRGDRVGFIGANGMGKTTLLRLLLGQLAPDGGTVKTGTKLELAYFDQLRSQLDAEKTVIDNMAEGREFITINGKSRHVISYLQDFLFAPERARQPVKALSGGEQNRLILARLFSKPANVLVLDEPTNDLDMETLELLEELLLGFEGTILLVSHDRDFLDNVVTSCIVFEGDGVVNEYVGGYRDWLRRGQTLPSLDKKTNQTMGEQAKPVKTPADNAPRQAAKKKKLSYKLQRELETLPGTIEKLEQQQAVLSDQVEQPNFYQQDHQTTQSVLAKLAKIQEELETAYHRWAELEELD